MDLGLIPACTCISPSMHLVLLPACTPHSFAPGRTESKSLSSVSLPGPVVFCTWNVGYTHGRDTEVVGDASVKARVPWLLRQQQEATC